MVITHELFLEKCGHLYQSLIVSTQLAKEYKGAINGFGKDLVKKQWKEDKSYGLVLH